MTTRRTEAILAAMRPSIPTYDDYYAIGLAENLAQSLYKNLDLSVLHGSRMIESPSDTPARLSPFPSSATKMKIQYRAAVVKNSGEGGDEVVDVDGDREEDRVTPVFRGATRLEAVRALLYWLEEKAGVVLGKAGEGGDEEGGA